MRKFLPLLLAAACGPSSPTDTTDGGSGDSGPVGSTSTGDSITSSSGGLDETGSTSGSSSDGSDSSSDDGSTSDGSSSSSDGQGSTGAPVCELVDFMGRPRCECDGLWVDPIACGCIFVAEGCECDGVLLDPQSIITCAWPCIDAGTGCICGNFPAPQEWCSA